MGGQVCLPEPHKIITFSHSLATKDLCRLKLFPICEGIYYILCNQLDS